MDVCSLIGYYISVFIAMTMDSFSLHQMTLITINVGVVKEKVIILIYLGTRCVYNTTLRERDNLSIKDTSNIPNTFSTSEKRTASLQGTKWLVPKCPLLKEVLLYMYLHFIILLISYYFLGKDGRC